MILNTKNLSLSFGPTPILSGIDLTLNAGDRLAVVGVNGAGKTTLLRLLLGQLEPTEGSVTLASGIRVGYLQQNVFWQSDRTVLEEMLDVFSPLIQMEQRLAQLEAQMQEGSVNALEEYRRLQERFGQLGGLEFRGRTVSTLTRLGFPAPMHSLPVNSLSGGQKTVLMLVKALLQQPELLILDEPTNHLDMQALHWLENHLRKIKTTLIVVSHDRYFLDRTTTKTLEIENTRGTLYSCSYTQYRQEKQKARQVQEKQYQDQQKEVRRIQEFIKLQHKWNREKNIIAAESRQKALDRMVKVERPDRLPQNIHFSFDAALRSGNDVLSVEALAMRYGDRVLFEDLSFELKRTKRLFIVGPNGCGKSTLLKILCSRLEPVSGHFQYGYNVKIGYYDQENQDLMPDNTVLEELWQGAESLQETRRLLSLFGFYQDEVFRPVRELSGGEKARLTLAKLMQKKVNLLILDEPTNHLDIGSREALEQALQAFDGTVIAVSHDRYFVSALADQILDLGGHPQTGKISLFDGSFPRYMAYLEGLELSCEPQASSGPSASASKQNYEQQKQLRNQKRNRERNLEKTEARIGDLEKLIAELDQKMCGEAQSDYQLLEQLYAQKADAEAELEKLYLVWEELQTQ